MKTTLSIHNLKCDGCVNTIITRLNELDGISNVIVAKEDQTVSFKFKEQDDLINAAELLAKLGYPIDGYSNTLSRKAKSYLSCAIGRYGN
ncbi:MAG: heavy-metal-associated domain-containing protein [Flavobacteriaceae bacterium]|nr:heavy-metal-associated domain-containing protein [Bacteroidia bacterium]MBT8286526.1 heavy-metal-associated domain-containing protein [Bacteroidia bacterium]NNF73560.1 heavy-metal-associated domain-containing protein [Flavobacteriaceae bacterium]NNK73707.1 heavy-metal-associated domain-containing protein [Flavobacteriaceae bacterium]